MNYNDWLTRGRAFTLRSPAPDVNRVIVPITILCDSRLCSDGKSKTIQTAALWDTGATISSIDSELARKLNLIPTGKCEISGVSGKVSDPVSTYSFKISMGGLNIFVNKAASGIFAEADFKMLIGMDIIRMGEMYLGLEEVDGKPGTLFSFSVPPTGEAIDYVEKLNKARKAQARSMSNSIPAPRPQVISRTRHKKRKR